MYLLIYGVALHSRHSFSLQTTLVFNVVQIFIVFIQQHVVIVTDEDVPVVQVNTNTHQVIPQVN